MSENAAKVLTRKQVEKLGFDKLSVITADMLEGYTSIGGGAFYGCRALTSVTIPNSVTSIGNGAFSGCSRLTSVTIPDGITRIGDWTFANCSSLTSVVIGNGVTSIGGYAFYACKSLTSIEIPNNVSIIGEYAFSACSNLGSVTIRNNFTYIRTYAFQFCKFDVVGRSDEYGRIIAYKGFNADMTCRDFKYKEGETYELDCEPILCEQGFHACLNPLDCLNYYNGKIGDEVVFHEVYLEGVSDIKSYDSKVVAKKITISREISLSDMADISSGRK